MLGQAHAQAGTPAWLPAFENGLRPAVREAGDKPQRWSIEERMAHHRVPGMSIAVIQNGKLVFAKGYGVANAETRAPVTTDTVFSVGSVSKIGAAATTLRLVADGKLDLDEPVNNRLTSWSVPENLFTQAAPVTLRGILSHTAGLTVHGFPDFQPGDTLPSVVDTLEGRPPAVTEPVRVFYTPGTRVQYSGGGTTVEQLVISDVTGQSFEGAAARYVFEPLGMSRSTYQNPLSADHGDISSAHDEEGNVTAKPRGWHTFPEKAASGLWTTPTDFSRLVIAFLKSYHGERRSFLPASLAADMLSEVGPSPFGLGPMLTGEGMTRRFYHGGSNESYKAWFEGHVATGDGFVIFTNSSHGSDLYIELRRALADALDWPFYQEIVIPNQKRVASFADQFVGRYEMRAAYTPALTRIRIFDDLQYMDVVRKSGELFLLLPDEDETLIPLLRLGPTQYIATGVYAARPEPMRVEFVRGTQNKITQMVMYHGRYSESAYRTNRLGTP